MTRLLAISGSLRRGSYNTALLRAAAAARPPDVEFAIWGGLAEIPAFNEDIDALPAAVAALRHEIAQADAVLFATPEYNGSIPGALKNALDWVSRPFTANVLRGKPVAVIGASQGVFGAIWAQAELRKVLSRMDAYVDEHDLPVGVAHEALTDNMHLRDPELQQRLQTIVACLTSHTTARAA